MANKKQSLKYIRQTETRTARNRATRSRLKTLSRKVRELREGDDAEAKKTAAIEAISAYDKACKAGVVHPNKVSRLKASVAPLLD